MKLEDAVYVALGRITTGFQQAELALVLVITHLIDVKGEIGMIVCSQLSFSRMCAIAVPLLRERAPDPEHRDLIEEFEKLICRANEGEQQRNVLIHSWWGINHTDPSQAVRLKIKLRKGKILPDQELLASDTKKLSEVGDMLYQIGFELFEFHTKLRRLGIVAPELK